MGIHHQSILVAVRSSPRTGESTQRVSSFTITYIHFTILTLTKSPSFCLNMGWLYTRLVQTYSVPPEALASPNLKPISSLRELGIRMGGGSGYTSFGMVNPRAAAVQLNDTIRDFIAMCESRFSCWCVCLSVDCVIVAGSCIYRSSL